MNLRSICSPLFGLFLLLSLADLGLTCWLLYYHGDWVYESNPVARWWYEQFGFAGLVGLKAIVILLIGAITVKLESRRPQLSRHILGGASALLLCVVAYSIYLGYEVTSYTRYINELTVEAEYLNKAVKASIEYNERSIDLCEDLRWGRITLKEAVRELLPLDQIHNTQWIDVLKMEYGTESISACLARNLLQRFVVSMDQQVDDHTWDQLVGELEQDFGLIVTSTTFRRLRTVAF